MTHKLVYGGTRKLYSNRAMELASNLQQVNQTSVDYYTKMINNSSTVSDLKDVLSEMAKNNINFVGSRDYVYFSDAMSGVIDMLVAYGVTADNCVLLTRCCNLREKAVELILDGSSHPS